MADLEEIQNFVIDSYKSILERNPDLDGLKHYTNMLKYKAINRDDLLKILKNSDEYKKKMKEKEEKEKKQIARIEINKKRWNIFLMLQGNCEDVPATSKDIVTPLESLKERFNDNNIFTYFALPQYRKILVVGAGDGGEVKILNEKSYDTIGITLHWSDKKYAKDFLNVDLHIEDMHDMSFKHETFDGVYSYHSLEHAVSPLIALFEIRRVLKENGKLYIIVPQSGTSNETGLQHYSVLTETLWKHLLDIIGFKDIEVYSTGGNTIMKAKKDNYKDCPGKQFEMQLIKEELYK